MNLFPGGTPFEEQNLKRIKKTAKQKAKSDYIKLLYRKKYSLPPNDPRFLDMDDIGIFEDLMVSMNFESLLEKESEKSESVEIDSIEQAINGKDGVEFVVKTNLDEEELDKIFEGM